MDRRTGTSHPGDLHIAGQRLRKRTIRFLEAHDLKFVDRDPVVWQTDYSLLKHCLDVSRRMEITGVIEKVSPLEFLCLSLAGLDHDVGKDDEKCHIYRLKRDLAPAQLETMTTHQMLSGLQYLEDLKFVRKSDVSILTRIRPQIAFHHTPWAIPETELQRPAIKLQLTDATQGWTEERHRPAKSLDEALEIVDKWIHTTLLPTGFGWMRPMYEECFEVVREAFLLDLPNPAR